MNRDLVRIYIQLSYIYREVLTFLPLNLKHPLFPSFFPSLYYPTKRSSDDIGSFDAHPVNPHYTVGAPPAASSSTSEALNRAERKAIEAGDRISVAVQVNGTVRYGKAGGEGFVEHAFNEAWLLVPHWEAWARNPPRNLRRWVVVSQNFRTL